MYRYDNKLGNFLCTRLQNSGVKWRKAESGSHSVEVRLAILQVESSGDRNHLFKRMNIPTCKLASLTSINKANLQADPIILLI